MVFVVPPGQSSYSSINACSDCGTVVDITRTHSCPTCAVRKVLERTVNELHRLTTILRVEAELRSK